VTDNNDARWKPEIRVNVTQLRKHLAAFYRSQNIIALSEQSAVRLKCVHIIGVFRYYVSGKS